MIDILNVDDNECFIWGLVRHLKNSFGISVFGHENKEKHPIFVSKKCCEEKHVDLLLTGEEVKRHYVLINDFNTFIYDHTLHREKKFFCRYCFSTEEKLKFYIKDSFQVNGKQRTFKVTIYYLCRF